MKTASFSRDKCAMLYGGTDILIVGTGKSFGGTVMSTVSTGNDRPSVHDHQIVSIGIEDRLRAKIVSRVMYAYMWIVGRHQQVGRRKGHIVRSKYMLSGDIGIVRMQIFVFRRQ